MPSTSPTSRTGVLNTDESYAIVALGAIIKDLVRYLCARGRNLIRSLSLCRLLLLLPHRQSLREGENSASARSYFSISTIDFEAMRTIRCQRMLLCINVLQEMTTARRRTAGPDAEAEVT